jgi:hypothetical protein
MQDYDAAVKLLLQSPANFLLRQATGLTISHWLNTELPKFQTTRADLLGTTEDDTLVHVELQSTNDSTMAFRMVDYALRIYPHPAAKPSRCGTTNSRTNSQSGAIPTAQRARSTSDNLEVKRPF